MNEINLHPVLRELPEVATQAFVSPLNIFHQCVAFVFFQNLQHERNVVSPTHIQRKKRFMPNLGYVSV